jgi:LPXTG-motif cell wall-anchored protein
VLAIAVAVAAAALGAVVAPGAAGKDHGNSKPRASLRISDRTVTVGEEVVLDSSRSRDRDGRIAYHLWDLDGDKVYETSTRRRARMRHAFDHAGRKRVGVVVLDDDGGYAERRATIRVVSRRARHAEPAGKHGRHGRVRTATKKKDKGKGKGKGRARHHAKADASSGDKPATLHAAATSNAAVTISDFKFDPKTITVSVGDTVTWTNNGPAAHTATADDGTFDTGNLVKGAAGSYKFTKAGTYKYHCTPHPFMTATVTVTGSGGSSAPDETNSNSTNGSNSGSGKKSNLPHTGLQIASFVLAGLALLGAGAALRRRLVRP